MNNNIELPELITFKQLHEHFGIPRTSAYRYMDSNNNFPLPIQVGPNAVRLRKAEVEKWIATRPHAHVHGLEGAA